MIPPDTQDIHLWCIHDSPLHESLLEPLSAEERAHLDRIRAPGVRQQYWQTRLGIRRLLSLYAPDVSPASWQFIRNAHGRPALKAPVLPFELCFNISHTPGLIVIAFSRGGDLGVDVERTDRSSRSVDLAERYFSAQELAGLRGLAPERQAERFLRLWTLKESYIKACGKGLAIPLGSFSFLLDRPGIGVEFDASRQDDPERWRFWQLTPVDGYLIALALGRKSHADDYRICVRTLRGWEEGEKLQANLL